VTLASNFDATTGIATDAAGNIFLACYSSNVIKEIPVGGGAIVTLGAAFSQLSGITIDNAGNLYAIDEVNTVKKLTFAGGYVVSPELPQGLNINNTTGVISGTPNSGSPATNYTITGSNAAGNATASLNITVNGFTNLALGAGTLQPAFTPGVYTYSVKLSSAITSINVSPTDSDPGATITVNGVAVVSGASSAVALTTSKNNIITVSVTATGGATWTYTINVVQFPVISYSGPQTYIAGTTITPLTPTSVGVDPPAYNNTTTFYLGEGFFSSLRGIAIDNSGNIYVCDPGADQIKKVPVAGGNPVILAFDLSNPLGVAVDGNGANIYVAESGKGLVKRIPLRGGGTTAIIGTGFINPVGVMVDKAGDVYVADNGNNAVYEIAAGSGNTTMIANGFPNITAIAGDVFGNIYVTDATENAVFKIAEGESSGQLIAGGFNNPSGVAVDPSGNLFVVDPGNVELKEIIAGTTTPLVIGTGFQGAGVVVNQAGIVYFSDAGGSEIRGISPIGGYYISSTLPAGLSFSNTTGIISGSPTVVSPATNYVITAYNTMAQAGSATVNIGVKLPSTNANLASLKISNGTLSPVFTAANTSYTAVVANIVTAITLTPATGDATATLKVNGTTVASGTATASIPLNLGPNTITTMVTAQDGITTKTYTLTVTRLASTDALLTSIKLTPASALTLVTSGPGDVNYTTTVAPTTSRITITPTTQDATATIKVNGILVASGTASQLIPLSVGSNVIDIVSTAQDGVTTKTYTITATKTVSSTASLANLKISSGTLTPVFATGTAAYTASVANSITSITVTPTVTDATATVKVNGLPVGSGSASSAIPLVAGTNNISTIVTAQDGAATQTYTVSVTRAPSTDALLTSIKLTPVSTLTVITGPSYVNYTTTVAATTSSLTVTAAEQDPTATLKINGVTTAPGTASAPITLTTGTNTINIVSTAQDGVTTKTYTITATKPESANLSALKLSSGILSPTFATATTNYTSSVTNATTSITVTPTTADATATVTINGTSVTSGTASSAIPLTVGANKITTIVTAQNGTTTQTYTVTVTRAASADALLTSIKLSPASTLIVVTGPGYVNYTTSVPNSTSSVTVTATEQDATATITVNGITTASGTASAPITLTTGTNVINIVSTAQDGVTTKTYTITATKPASANLSALKLSSGTLSPAFSMAITNYTASVTNATALITATPTTADPTATVTVNGTAVTSGTASAVMPLTVGQNKITTVVTNGAATQTYTVTVTRAASTDALLTSIKLTPAATLKIVTGPSYVNYTTSVPNATGSITITATEQDLTATIKVNGITTASGTASAQIALAVGSNTINIVSTAQDGVTAKTYTVAATRAAAPGMNNPDETLSVTKPVDNITIENDGITVHQGVSPNGDGINDYLTIEGITSYPDNKLTIVDKNGGMIYQTKGYDNSSKLFDGHSNINGKMQLPGTYFYSLDYAVKGQSVHKTGFIILKY